ncbi:MAG: DUF2924 domain-containing protein, partial [Prevotellaceae bacterium]|nr:DUF2924 domain-containing protein [Prevotellaceae bacterium]
MQNEIFSILAKAIETAAQTPQKPRFSSVLDKKVIENLCQSSEYKDYVSNSLINGVEILMNNDKDLVYSQIAQLSTLPIKDLKKAWKEKTGIEPPPHMQKRALIERLAYKIQELAFG